VGWRRKHRMARRSISLGRFDPSIIKVAGL
jgi:hypothetical protein